ncbi:hypothetical protein BH24CHL4_BH24CHL4_12180 [soil metagenome]
MDYVIAGLGFGAVLAIVGFLLRELGLSRRRPFPRWMPDAGVALMCAALIIWVVTAAAFFSGLDDDTALRVVTGSAVVATLGSLAAAAVMNRTYKSRTILVPAFVMAQAPQSEDSFELVEAVDRGSPVVAGEGTEHADAVQPSTGIEAEIPAEAEPEKNWPEIWRQTWGGGGTAADPAPAELEGSGSKTVPVEVAVLEDRGASSDSEAERSPDQQDEEAASAGMAPGPAPSSDDQSIELPPEDSGAENEAKPSIAAMDTVESEPEQTGPGSDRADEAAHGAGSLNGNDPEADLEDPASEAGLANSRNRDQA